MTRGTTIRPSGPDHPTRARPKKTILSNPTQGRGQHAESLPVGDTRVRPFSPHLPLQRCDSIHGKQVPEPECPRLGPGHSRICEHPSRGSIQSRPPPREDLTQASQASTGTDTPPRESPLAADVQSPPRELEITRTSNACKGDKHWLRLGKNGDKWLWAVHANPPLRASTRPTVATALELWLSRYGHEITPESHGQAVELLQTWKTYQGPGPDWTDRRKRGLSQPPLPREKRATRLRLHKLPRPNERLAPRARPADDDRKDLPQRTAQLKHNSLCHAPGAIL